MTNSNGNPIEQRLSEIQSRVEGMDREFSRRTNIILDEVLVLTQQMESLTGSVEQLTTEVNRLTLRVNQVTERVDQLTENQEVTQANVNQLVDLMVQFAQNAEADRSIIRGIQTENQRILLHLFGEENNG
jgi:methyl-accepting chemotaxis protein